MRLQKNKTKSTPGALMTGKNSTTDKLPASVSNYPVLRERHSLPQVSLKGGPGNPDPEERETTVGNTLFCCHAPPRGLGWAGRETHSGGMCGRRTTKQGGRKLGEMRDCGACTVCVHTHMPGAT